MSDFIASVLAAIVTLTVLGLAFFAVIATISEFVVRHECSTYERITGVETKKAFLTSCYVKNGDVWQRWDEYIARSTASELAD